jgi:hypothetical protein
MSNALFRSMRRNEGCDGHEFFARQKTQVLLLMATRNNMRTRLVFIWILTLCPSVSSFARLGETLDECKARYGDVARTEYSREDYPQYCFLKGNIEIRVRLLSGVSAQEIFFGRDGNRMSQAQITEILQANSGGVEWRNAPPEDYAAWNLVRSDGKAHATYDVMATINTDILTIETFEFRKAFNAPGTGF